MHPRTITNKNGTKDLKFQSWDSIDCSKFPIDGLFEKKKKQREKRERKKADSQLKALRFFYLLQHQTSINHLLRRSHIILYNSKLQNRAIGRLALKNGGNREIFNSIVSFNDKAPKIRFINIQNLLILLLLFYTK